MYTLLLTFFLTLSAVWSAPISLDDTTLLRNVQEAQVLNNRFKTLKATDSCIEGQAACLGNSTAICQNSKWDVNGRCPNSESCFALPSTRNAGIALTCATEENALAVFNATGIEGGIFGAGKDINETGVQPTSNSSDTPTVNTSTPPAPPPSAIFTTSTSTSATPKSTDNATADVSTSSPSLLSPIPSGSAAAITSIGVSFQSSSPSNLTFLPSTSSSTIRTETVTVVLQPNQPTTLPPQTLTISDAQASSLVSSVLAAGGSVVPSTDSATISTLLPTSSTT